MRVVDLKSVEAYYAMRYQRTTSQNIASMKSPLAYWLTQLYFTMKCNPTYELWYMLGGCDESGAFHFYDTRDAAVNRCFPQTNELKVHWNAALDFDWNPKFGQTVLIASADNSITYNDIHCKKMLHRFVRHVGSVRSISWCADDPHLFTSGGRDGNIFLWDIRERDSPVQMLLQAHETPQSGRGCVGGRFKSLSNREVQPICALLYSSQRYVLSGGCADRGIHVWDTRKTRLSTRSSCLPLTVWPYSPSEDVSQHRIHGFSSFTMDPQTMTVFAPCSDSSIYQYNLRTLDEQPMRRLYSTGIHSMFVRCSVSPHGPYVACHAGRGEMGVWNYKKSPYPQFIMTGHESEVTSTAWNIGDQLVSSGDDYGWRLWMSDWRQKFEEDPFNEFRAAKQLTVEEQNEKYGVRGRRGIDQESNSILDSTTFWYAEEHPPRRGGHQAVPLQPVRIAMTDLPEPMDTSQLPPQMPGSSFIRPFGRVGRASTSSLVTLHRFFPRRNAF